MIKAARRPLSDAESRRIIEWLSHDGSAVFRTCLRDLIAEVETGCGEMLCGEADRDAEVKTLTNEAAFLNRMMRFLDEVRGGRRELYRISVQIDQ